MLHDKYLENLYQSEVVFLKYLPSHLSSPLTPPHLESFEAIGSGRT